MAKKIQINNEIYKYFNNDWYESNDYIAMLRAESRARNPWIVQKINENIKYEYPSILDVGCGGGLLTNELAKHNFKVTGMDIHNEVLHIAKKYNESKNVDYLCGDAHSLPFPNEHFDIICALDVLEHVDDYLQVLSECSRCVKKNGLIFFHTFNRNLFTKLFVIKGMEYFVKNTPKYLHVYNFFIKPNEIIEAFSNLNCKIIEIKGLNPKIFSKSFAKLVFSGEVNDDFEFVMSNSLMSGYIGYIRKI
ncbi:bifunctional 2-polyprenyl-6-hydroxyphenol methylase/3-demethylubiquinol 3-O-methyltransferase UbiG [Fluviispira multicolorata]|uniref:3-demethylubiquinone-9 3-O-methyltransferase n=1 Tax=Fluviispira multicolorata TaxID=2654512 RepID=A0A833JF65_9BACT|nr:bifunctional 2-polyprenyl-6-hydroxyphenol methylase/3-demethylubiquinol 3-O-methyltransferase UbiG [Fluviispira multicolorata]KAB8030789.1 3-demethylubiquinone-9 3-O-methyltransferase [Fluviispira multicolorata]